LPEDDGENDDEKRENTAAKDEQIVPHECHHVVGDHRHATEIQRAVMAVRLDDVSDLRDRQVALLIQRLLRLIVVGLDLFQRFRFVVGKAGLSPFVTQLLSGPTQFFVLLMLDERQGQRGGSAIGADNELAVDRAIDELGSGAIPVDIRFLQTRQILEHLRDGLVRAIEERGIEHREHGVHAGYGPELLTEFLQRLQSFVGEEILVGGVGHDEQIGTWVALADIPEYLEVDVVLQQQGVGRRIEPEVLRVIAEKRQNQEQHDQNGFGALEHQRVVDLLGTGRHRGFSLRTADSAMAAMVSGLGCSLVNIVGKPRSESAAYEKYPV
jgi:hypothetical protein